jgi:hypothetical protein
MYNGFRVAIPHDEEDLERALAFLYQQWRLLGYRQLGFYRLFTRDCRNYRGGIAAVQHELRTPSASSSLEFLHQRGKKAFCIERLVLRETWCHLFTEDDRRLAQSRLLRYSG